MVQNVMVLYHEYTALKKNFHFCFALLNLLYKADAPPCNHLSKVEGIYGCFASAVLRLPHRSA